MNDSGLLVIDKPAGWTSHQVVGRVRRLLGTRKVGHAGTLDPMATGCLLLGVNRATRLLGHLALHDKCYLATIRLGQSTTTDDAEGEVLFAADASEVMESALTLAVADLTGHIMQRPSSVSAIKVNGKRAYALVRGGQDVKLAARPVVVSRFVVLAKRYPEPGLVDLDVEVECSSGTYVRALARDLGEALGVGGHLTALRRTRIGSYLLSEAQSLDSAKLEMMTMAQAAALSFPCVEVSAEQAKDIGYGRAIDLALEGQLVGLISPSGELLALYRPDGDQARPVAVLS